MGVLEEGGQIKDRERFVLVFPLLHSRDIVTKRKEGNIRFVIFKIRDQRGFTGGIDKTNALEISNIKKALRIESTMHYTSCSAELVGRKKYAATITVKSLIETEGKVDREIMR